MSSVFQLKLHEDSHMDFNDFRNSEYLTQRDIKNLSPEERRVTVDRVGADRVGEEKKNKVVTHFASLEKELVTNITNCEVLAEIAGSANTVDWPGAHVEIYVDPNVTFGGKRCGGIRLRPIAIEKPPSVEDDFDDEIPFGDPEAT